jgi:signal peptidase I
MELFSGNFDGARVLPLLSGSMAPTLIPGDLLTVQPLDGKRPHAGDIVVFREEHKLVAHRLLLAFRIFSLALYLQKGDANRKIGLVKPEQIVGRVADARRMGTLVLEDTPEARGRGHRLASRELVRYLFIEAPIELMKKAVGRHA